MDVALSSRRVQSSICPKQERFRLAIEYRKRPFGTSRRNANLRMTTNTLSVSKFSVRIESIVHTRKRCCSSLPMDLSCLFQRFCCESYRVDLSTPYRYCCLGCLLSAPGSRLETVVYSNFHLRQSCDGSQQRTNPSQCRGRQHRQPIYRTHKNGRPDAGNCRLSNRLGCPDSCRPQPCPCLFPFSQVLTGSFLFCRIDEISGQADSGQQKRDDRR